MMLKMHGKLQAIQDYSPEGSDIQAPARRLRKKN